MYCMFKYTINILETTLELLLSRLSLNITHNYGTSTVILKSGKLSATLGNFCLGIIPPKKSYFILLLKVGQPVLKPSSERLIIKMAKNPSCSTSLKIDFYDLQSHAKSQNTTGGPFSTLNIKLLIEFCTKLLSMVTGDTAQRDMQYAQ